MTLPDYIERHLPWPRKRSNLLRPLDGPDTRGFGIFTEDEMAEFYRQTPEVQAEWNNYYRAEAKAFDDRYSYDKQVYLMHQWTPPLRFAAWIKRRSQ